MPAAPNGRLGRIRWDNPPQGPVPAEELVTDLAEPVALVIDNTHVYFSESSLESDVAGSIKRFDRTASTIETLARAQSPDDVVGDLDMHGETLAWWSFAPENRLSSRCGSVRRTPTCCRPDQESSRSSKRRISRTSKGLCKMRFGSACKSSSAALSSAAAVMKTIVFSAPGRSARSWL